MLADIWLICICIRAQSDTSTNVSDRFVVLFDSRMISCISTSYRKYVGRAVKSSMDTASRRRSHQYSYLTKELWYLTRFMDKLTEIIIFEWPIDWNYSVTKRNEVASSAINYDLLLLSFDYNSTINTELLCLRHVWRGVSSRWRLSKKTNTFINIWFNISIYALVWTKIARSPILSRFSALREIPSLDAYVNWWHRVMITSSLSCSLSSIIFIWFKVWSHETVEYDLRSLIRLQI